MRLGQIAHREQRLRLAQHDSWEDLEAAFLCGLVPVERAASVRSHATIDQDAPGADANRLVFARLALQRSPPSHRRANPGAAYAI